MEDRRMRSTGVFRAACYMGCAALALSPLRAQDVARAVVPPVTRADGAGLLWPQHIVRFANAKPVLGMPLKSAKSMVRCASDNTAFFNLVGDSQLSDVAEVPRLYSISTDGEVKSLLRKLPVDFNDLTVKDFFVSEHRVVTLVRAARRDDQGASDPKYFLSSLDTQGDFRESVEVEGRFRPMKIGVFGDGEFLVLGWDDANLLPMLALVKESGQIRHFLDVDDVKAKGALSKGHVSAALLQDAALVSFGGDVLLTFPGTANALLDLSTGGAVGPIPIALPAGYVLHDVLYTVSRPPTIVVRARAKKDTDKPGEFDEANDPTRRLFEFSAHGALLRELVPDIPKVADVTCAGGGSLTAIYYGTVFDSTHSATNTNASTSGAQLVVSSARR
jgi:hypothetical protein